MKVLICGAGRVGTGIARHLAADGSDVTVIDRDETLTRQIQESLDVRAVLGHGSYPDVLDRAGAADADMIIAVTSTDEVNMMATQVAHSLFNVPRKIARVRAQSYLVEHAQKLFGREHMPIDHIISPEIEVGDAVLRRLRHPGAFDAIDFADGAVEVIGVRVGDGAAVVDVALSGFRDILPQRRFMVLAISRTGTYFVPSGSDRVEVGDDVYFVAPAEDVQAILAIFGHEEHEARKVVIVGAGHIGRYVAQQLERRRIKTKVIETDLERAEGAADELDRTVVLHGSGLDQGVLREADVPNAESVVTVTNDDEANILSSLIARKLGALRAITLINDPDYGDLVRSLDIGAFLDPRATTVSKILQYVRRGRVKRVHSIGNGIGEVIEAEALQTAPIVGRSLKDAKLPSGIIMGAVVRDGVFLLPDQAGEVRGRDRVVLFAARAMVPRVEQLFRVGLEYF